MEKNIFNHEEKLLCFKFSCAPKLFVCFGKFCLRVQREEKNGTKLFSQSLFVSYHISF